MQRHSGAHGAAPTRRAVLSQPQGLTPTSPAHNGRAPSTAARKHFRQPSRKWWGRGRRRPRGGDVMFLTAAAREWRGAGSGGGRGLGRAAPRRTPARRSLDPSTGCQRCDLPFGAGPEPRPLGQPRCGTAAPSGPLCRPLPACSARPPAGPQWRREAGRAVRWKAVMLDAASCGGTVVKESGRLEVGSSCTRFTPATVNLLARSLWGYQGTRQWTALISVCCI